MVALFIINPVAGEGDQNDIRQKVAQYHSDIELTAHFLETSGENDAERIREALQTYSPEIVFACGGDGTVNLVGEILRGTPVTLGIIPRGSANGLATELELPYNVHDCLDVLLSGPRINLDTLIINDTYHCLHLADIGYNAQLIHDFESLKQRGHIGYLRGFLKTMKERPTAEITYNGPAGKEKEKVIMAVFANARMYGTGAVINPKGRLDDGHFELVLFRPWPRWYFPFLMVLSLFGKINMSRYTKIIVEKEVQVKLKTPLPLQVDGEPRGQVFDIQVRVCQNKISLAVRAGYFD